MIVFFSGNKIYCPDCSKHGCDFMSCETCVYGKEINHDTLMHPFKTCELKVQYSNFIINASI